MQAAPVLYCWDMILTSPNYKRPLLDATHHGLCQHACAMDPPWGCVERDTPAVPAGSLAPLHVLMGLWKWPTRNIESICLPPLMSPHPLKGAPSKHHLEDCPLLVTAACCCKAGLTQLNLEPTPWLL